MSATTPKKNKIVRKNEKRYEQVTFEVPEIFDGALTFPSLQRAPMRVLVALEEGNLAELPKFLAHSTDPDSVDAFLDLDPDELEPVLTAWGKASQVDAQKSN